MVEVVRNELKYYINWENYNYLRDILKSSMPRDKYDLTGDGYFIRSVYFDSIDNKSFTEKMQGVEERKKYRLRLYGLDDESVKFEIKNKINNKIHKETAIISREDAKKILDGNVEVLLKYKNSVLNKIYIAFRTFKYRPVVSVDYYREAYVGNFNNIRVTFDKFLSRSRDVSFFEKPSERTLFDKNNIILEVKYDKFLPSWIKKILSTVSANKSAISKYCIARIEG
ncbi:hypothetical protein BVX95_00675 [archaeon D22]|nr:hypothetical protein BVX95_00675 [archaeon D22]